MPSSTLLSLVNSLSHSHIFAISRGQVFRIRSPHDIACSSTCWFLDLNYHRPSPSLQMPVRLQPACTMRPCQRKSQVKETSWWALCRLPLSLLQLLLEKADVLVQPQRFVETFCQKRTKAFVVPCRACLWFLRNFGSVPLRDGYLEVFGFLMLYFAQNVSADRGVCSIFEKYGHWLEEPDRGDRTWGRAYPLRWAFFDCSTS